jgi:hypothetical protein
MNVGSASPLNPSSFSRPASGTPQLTSDQIAHLKTLGIDPAKVTHLSKQDGTGRALLQNGIQIIALTVTPELAAMLKQLGIQSPVHLALAVQGQALVGELRKKMKDLEAEMTYSDQLGEIADMLGISLLDGLIVVDQEGSVSLVQSGLLAVADGA